MPLPRFALAAILVLALLPAAPMAAAAPPPEAFTNDAATLARFEFDGSLADLSGNGRAATRVGGGISTFVASAHGQGLSLSTWQDGLNWDAHAATLVAPFTIELVVKSTNVASFRKLFSWSDSSDFGFYIVSGGVIDYNTGSIGTGRLSANTYHYLAFVVTSATAYTAYIDGVQVGSKTTSRSYATAPAQARFTSDDAATGRGEQINGVLDALRISNVARTPAEVAETHCRIADTCGALKLSSQSASGYKKLTRGGNTANADVAVGTSGQTFVLNEAAVVNVDFGLDAWSGTLHYRDFGAGQSITLALGTVEGGVFTPVAGASETLPLASGAASLAFTLTPSAPFVVQEGAAIALRLAPTGTGLVRTGGLEQSLVTMPASDPGYPTPELATIALVAAGAVLAAVATVRRR